MATQGMPDSFLAASHLTQMRRGHQITAVSLYTLIIKGYDEYTLNVEKNDQFRSFHECREEMLEKTLSFLIGVDVFVWMYWSGILELQFCVFQLVRAFRYNFTMYINTIKQILPWMFAMDHPNYARWSAYYRL